jgi:hypothetical protein
VLIGGVIFVCCGYIIGISTLRDFYFKSCLAGYADRLSVELTTVAVTTELLESINARIAQDMSVEEVHREFNEVVRTRFSNEGTTLDGGFQEIAMLNLCPFIWLDTVLINYSREGYFIEAYTYFGDS